MKEFLEELEYNQKVNIEKGLENRVDIDYIIERLKSINSYFEVARCEVENAIEDIANDELWRNDEEVMKNIEQLTSHDINRLAYKLEDENCWEDLYDFARDDVLDELTKEDVR